MVELNKQEFRKIIPMIKAANINTMFAIAVLEGKVDGKVYTDDEANSSSFYIQHPYKMSLLYGKTNKKDFYEQLVSLMLNKENTRDEFEWLQVYPSTLYEVIDNVLGENLIKKKPDDSDHIPEECKKVLEYQRINYSFQKQKYFDGMKNRSIDAIDNTFKLVLTSETIFNNLNERVVPKYYWNNYNDFKEGGIGYTVILNSGIPVSTAFAAFVNETKLEIGIETNKEYMGRGFATLVCSKVIEYCIENGYEPVWSCHSANHGSRKLANKLGFVETKRIPYYRLAKCQD